jgi:Protein of unknown function (DUF4235)
MKLIYKPFALVFSIIAARMGRNAFKSLWTRIDEQDPPDPTTKEAGLAKVVGAAALEAATVAGVAAAADRVAARTFHYLTGYWPGKKREEKKG